jgi:hypothetical protein
MKIVFLAVLGVATAAQGQQGLINPGSKDEVAYSPIESGGTSPIAKSGVFVIRSADEFHKYLTKLGELDLKRPKIDWTKYQVVAVHAQGYASAGFSPEIKRLHIVKPGVVDVELTIATGDWQNGSIFREPLNMAQTYSYPYVIMETPRIDAKWNIAVMSN